MKTILYAVGIALLLSIAGCVPGGLFMADPATMTPEQLTQYKEMGYDAIRCATVSGGPPVGGTVTSVTIPKDRPATVRFVGCTVQSIEVGGAQVQAGPAR